MRLLSSHLATSHFARSLPLSILLSIPSVRYRQYTTHVSTHVSTLSQDNINIPHTLPQDIIKWSCNDVEAFLKANRDEYRLDDTDISAIRTAKFNGRAMLRLEKEDLQSCGLRRGVVVGILGLIEHVKKSKGLGK